MKDKRTKQAIAIYNYFLKALAKEGVVGCRCFIKIMPPFKGVSKDERCWTLLLSNKDSNGEVVIAWHKTRSSARAQARELRKVL